MSNSGFHPFARYSGITQEKLRMDFQSNYEMCRHQSVVVATARYMLGVGSHCHAAIMRPVTLYPVLLIIEQSWHSTTPTRTPTPTPTPTRQTRLQSYVRHTLFPREASRVSDVRL